MRGLGKRCVLIDLPYNAKQVPKIRVTLALFDLMNPVNLRKQNPSPNKMNISFIRRIRFKIAYKTEKRTVSRLPHSSGSALRPND